MYDLLVFLMSAAAASATAPHGARADDLPEKIAYSETGPHGMGRVRWHLRTDGRGRYESNGSASEGVFRVDLNVGSEGFRRISAMVQPLEGRGEVQCELIATDQAHGSLTFHRGRRKVTFHLYQGCGAAPVEDAFRLMDAANLTILDWAGTNKWHNILVDGRGPNAMLRNDRR